jgi:hypothetical protein
MDGVLRSEWRYSVKRDNASSFNASSFKSVEFQGVKLLEVAWSLAASLLLSPPSWSSTAREEEARMHNRFAILLVVMMLVVTTAAFAQTAVDVTGRVVRVDPGAQLIILDNNQAFRVTPNTVLFVDNRPVTLGTVQPGQAWCHSHCSITYECVRYFCRETAWVAS